MRTVKQKVWRVSLRMMWMVIVFLIACKPNQDKKSVESTENTEKKDTVEETSPVVVDTIKKDTIAQVKVVPKKKPLPRKDTIVIKPRPTDPGPVCKYGVMRKEINTTIGGDS